MIEPATLRSIMRGTTNRTRRSAALTLISMILSNISSVTAKCWSLADVGGAVVHEDVDRAGLGLGLAHEILEVLEPADVTGDRDDAPGERREFPCGRFQVLDLAAGDDHVRAGLGQAPCDRPADAAAAPGDEGDLAFESESSGHGHPVSVLARGPLSSAPRIQARSFSMSGPTVRAAAASTNASRRSKSGIRCIAVCSPAALNGSAIVVAPAARIASPRAEVAQRPGGQRADAPA